MNNLVQINQNNVVVTNSKLLAEKFSKAHYHVLRDIQNLEIPEDFRKSNFGLSSLRAGTRSYPMYEITFDGFTLLAMGYTGKKAMQFKIEYIKAFRAMENQLKAIYNDQTIVREHTRKLPAGKKEIVLSAKAKEEVGGITKAVITKALEEKLPQYLGHCNKLPDELISDAFHQTVDEIQAKKQSELKEYQLSCSEAEIIEKIRSANAFNMLNLYIGVRHKLSA